MIAEPDELVAQAGELVIQLAVVRLGAVLLQGVHDGAGGLLAPQHQTLLHRCQCPQCLHQTSHHMFTGSTTQSAYWICLHCRNTS